MERGAEWGIERGAEWGIERGAEWGMERGADRLGAECGIERGADRLRTSLPRLGVRISCVRGLIRGERSMRGARST